MTTETRADTATALTAASQHLQDARAEVVRIKSTIAKLPQPDARAGDRLQAAEVAFEDAGAAVAVGHTTNTNLERARKALTDAREAHGMAMHTEATERATRDGLARRLERANADVREAEATRDNARHDWLAAEADRADTEYARLAPMVADAYSRVIALHRHLDSKYHLFHPTGRPMYLPVVGPHSQRLTLRPDSRTVFDYRSPRQDAAHESLRVEIDSLTSRTPS